MATIPILPYPYHSRNYSDIQAFTERDGLTFIRTLAELEAYIRNVVVPHLDEQYNDLVTDWNNISTELVEAVNTAIANGETAIDDKITALQAAFNLIVQQIINSSIEMSDPVFIGLLNNAASQSRLWLDDKYASRLALDTTNTAVATKASQSALDTTNTAVATKASQSALDTTNTAVGTKASQTSVDTLDTDLNAVESTLAGRLSAASVANDITAGIAPIKRELGVTVKRAPGRVIGFIGDSHTLGNGASIQAEHRFATLVPMLAGTRYTALFPVISGVGGNTSADILARIDTDILSNANVTHVHVQTGTNDADSITPDAFAVNIKAIKEKVFASGRTLSVGLVPPRTSAAGSPTRQRSETAFNEWLQQWAPRNGVILADTRTPLINPNDGYLSAEYSSDGTHVNDAGHLQIAKAIADAYRAAMPTLPGSRVVNFNVNQMSNGIMSGGSASTEPNGWYRHANSSSGTVATFSTLDDASGTLKEGRWAEVDLNAAVASVSVLVSPAIDQSTAYTPGDKMSLELQLQVEDVVGFRAAALAGTGNVSLQMANSSIVTFGDIPVRYTADYATGPVRMEFIAPASTNMQLRIRVNAPAGARVKMRVGEVVVRNLTVEKAVTLS